MRKARIICWFSSLVFCLAVLYFVCPILSRLGDKQIIEIGKTLEKMRRAKIELIPAELNAATYYRQAIAELEKTSWGSFFEDSETALTSPWNSQEFPEPAALINNHPEIMGLICQGAKRQLCRGEVFPVLEKSNPSYPWTDEKYYPEFTSFILANLGLSLGEEGLDESIPTLKTTFKVLNHLEQKESFWGPMMVVDCERRYLYFLLRSSLFSDRVTVPFCQVVIEELTKLDGIAERALSKRMEAPFLGSTRWLICVAYGTPSVGSCSSKKEGPFRLGKIIGPLLWRYYTIRWPLGRALREYDRWVALIRKLNDTPPYLPRYTELEKEVKAGRLQLMRNPIFKLIVPKYTDFQETENKVNAMRRTTLILVALRLYHLEHGVYPEKLAGLVPKYLPSLPPDPFSEQPFIYKKKDGRITIASNKEFPSQDYVTVTFAE